MSSKINICEVLIGHFRTLRDADTKKISMWDIFTFIILPFIIAASFSFFRSGITKDLISLLVNFSAILTALLLSVLVLVYDQESKIRQRKDIDTFYESKKSLLTELYFNICYSILCGVFLVVLCFIVSLFSVDSSGYFYGATHEYFIDKANITLKINMLTHILCPMIIYVCVHLILNIIMIVKRMHALLTLDTSS
ncbi:hypothetical protein [Enterobacter hormaechei]|uniref:hypothetical protein n=1 Tax=Enterobacter hormaechei TaxID=158836 RepID=UPI0007938648|nr:hypothetical protein [Enterobacter hormaechei]EGQ5289065.1 hypothetical protein [Enterobacter hormaechei]MCO8197362.1 hypothetical protein [Enterobacter hormaechei]SAC20674.1 Uncharacterised protein [Enterobacter hormaechei]